MSNLIQSTFRLGQSAYASKRSIKKCLKHDLKSSSYILAQYYQTYFAQLEISGTPGLDEIESMIAQTKGRLTEYNGYVDAQPMLSNILSFFEALKVLVKKNMA